MRTKTEIINSMNSLRLYLLVFVLLIGCQAEQGPRDGSNRQAKQAVKDTLRAFFGAISAYDYQKLRNVTAENYVLIENGPKWPLDSLTALMRKNEKRQAKFTYEFSDMEATVEGSTAWMTYKNNGVMTMGDQKRHFDWTESAVFRRGDEGWKIVLLHSTLNELDSSHAGG